jgi:hypothetical protein
LVSKWAMRAKANVIIKILTDGRSTPQQSLCLDVFLPMHLLAVLWEWTLICKQLSLISRGRITMKETYKKRKHPFVGSSHPFSQYRSDDAILIGVDHHRTDIAPHLSACQTVGSYFRATERLDSAFTIDKCFLLLWNWQPCPGNIIRTDEIER